MGLNCLHDVFHVGKIDDWISGRAAGERNTAQTCEDVIL